MSTVPIVDVTPKTIADGLREIALSLDTAGKGLGTGLTGAVDHAVALKTMVHASDDLVELTEMLAALIQEDEHQRRLRLAHGEKA